MSDHLYQQPSTCFSTIWIVMQQTATKQRYLNLYNNSKSEHWSTQINNISCKSIIFTSLLAKFYSGFPGRHLPALQFTCIFGFYTELQSTDKYACAQLYVWVDQQDPSSLVSTKPIMNSWHSLKDISPPKRKLTLKPRFENDCAELALVYLNVCWKNVKETCSLQTWGCGCGEKGGMNLWSHMTDWPSFSLPC